MKFLVVGLGSMGRRRIRNLKTLAAGEVIGLDPRADRRDEARSRHGVTTVATLPDALAHAPDALIVSTPPDAHLEYARLAVGRGLHVFVEAGVDATGYDELAAVAARHGTVAAPSCTMRFHPSVLRIRELVASGAIGEVAGLTYHVGQYLPDWHPWEDYRTTYFAKRATGACREIVPFELCWLTWVLGPLDTVSALKAKRSALEADIDDLYQLVLRFRSGALGHLMVDAIMRVPTRAGRIVGEEGIVEWDAAARAVRLYRAADRQWTTFSEPEPVREPGYVAGEDMYVEEMRRFVRAALGHEAYGYTLAEDAQILAALAAAELSSARSAHVSLPSGNERIPCVPAAGDRFARSKALAGRARAIIPAGCHTYSKGDDQFPAVAPRFIERAHGCHAIDVDGNEFVDWGMGLRSVILGHAYAPVLDAVRRELERGSNFTRPSPLEVELAETLVELIPSAEMVKFGKNGSDATSAAVRLARAHTGRDHVARCRDNPFLSVDDWFIGSTECSAGVPGATRALTLQFDYNDIGSLEALLDAHPGRIAAIVMEPATTEPPAGDFLHRVRSLATARGAVLVFDEMITGFRWDLRGAQAYYGVTPDLSAFGKALGNGFSVSALAGKREIMRLGGLDHERERVFLLSSTHGGETHALAAALATVRELRRHEVVAHLWKIGQLLQDGLDEAARACGLGGIVTAEGYPCSPVIVCRDAAGRSSPEFRTLFLQEMIARGILIPYVAPSYAHREREVARTVEAARAALGVYARALEAGGVAAFLEGPAVKPVFRRYN